VTIDGGIGTWQVGLVDPGAAWQMPGGVNTAKLGALSGVDITAGVIGAWTSGGAFTGELAADAIKSLTALAGLGADVSAVLGEATTLKISGGDFSGDLTVRSGVKALTVAGAISGDIDVTNGDLLTLTASGGFSGVVEVERGKTQNLNISGGNFTGSFRTAGGVDKLTVAKGGFSGDLSTQGDIAAIKISGDLSGQLYSGGNIKTMTVGSMTDALAAAAGDFTTATVGGDMRRSFLFSGFDPGDDLAVGGSGDDADTPTGGSIKTVTIRGSMVDSAISASVAPGADGYVGTGDDEVAGAGTIGRVVVYGNISGANVLGVSYGVFAASNLPTVFYYRNQPFLSYGSAHTGSMVTPAGNLDVVDIRVTTNQIIITFNHAINTATIDFSETATVLVSPDADFGDGDNTNIGSYFATPIWTADGNILTLKLASGSFKKFDTLSLGMYFQVTLDGTVAGSDGDGAVTDNRGSILDGEYDDYFPTGDGQPGGNFVYTFQWGSKILDVPSYNWRFGCVPTSVGMLAGYYDGLGYSNLIPGDASDQLTNSDVDETIASSGDGEYIGYNLAYTIVTPGTPGTGYIPDYALYDEVSDFEAAMHRDLSDPAEQAAEGVTPHADNCIADFLLTSQSYVGLRMGETWGTDIAPGVEAFFDYKGYTATAQTEVFGVFTWNDLVTEIDAGRPVLLGVDSNADGTPDHEIIAVGYDSSTYEYLCNRTWESNMPPYRYAFQDVAPGHEFGISDATLVTVA
jgi:hypothetical protein